MNLDRNCVRCGKPGFIEVDGGVACWDCLTPQERRRLDFQCERCGAQFYDDLRSSDDGWLIENGVPGVFLCPACMTLEEDEQQTRSFQERVEKGQRLQGDAYPDHLARLAVSEQARLAERQEEADRLRRQLEDEG